jgi:hypothetical protein
MEEKRVYGRVNIAGLGKRVPCQVMSGSPREIMLHKEGQVRDICVGGLSLFLDEPLVKDDVVRLVIEFPFSVLREPGNATGRVAYCMKDARSSRYIAGIAYTRRNA